MVEADIINIVAKTLNKKEEEIDVWL
jgi:hypothetical protein